MYLKTHCLHTARSAVTNEKKAHQSVYLACQALDPQHTHSPLVRSQHSTYYFLKSHKEPGKGWESDAVSVEGPVTTKTQRHSLKHIRANSKPYTTRATTHTGMHTHTLSAK